MMAFRDAEDIEEFLKDFSIWQSRERPHLDEDKPR